MIKHIYRSNKMIFSSMHQAYRFLSSQTYYDVLGVKKSASPSEIRSAFIELSKKYHPDKYRGDSEMFKRINEAYSVLSQEKTRRMYDATLTSSSSAKSSPYYSQPWSDYDRTTGAYEYILHRRSMDYRKRTVNNKEDLKITKLIVISSMLMAFFTYVISMYTFLRK
ncbi:unnamed protein product [Trichobilharzia regenti]|nr:unnamed protein product [Trichobilharzia regenti]